MSGTTNVPGVCVLMRRNGKVLLILRANTGFKDNEYVVPSGHVEADETFKQAASREAEEEVGVKIRPEDLIYKTTVHRKGEKDTRIDVWFEALAWTGTESNVEADKHAHIKWYDEDELPENIVDYIAFGMECIKEDVGYGEFGWKA